MGYFSYLAKQAFATAPTGERLFFRGAAASRPYIIPDEATEERLFIKQRWIFRILIGGFILTQPLLFVIFPQLLQNPAILAAYVIGMIVLERVVGYFVFRSELKNLQQLDQPLPARDFYASFAARHSPWALKLGLGACVMFVLLGALSMAFGQMSLLTGALVTVFFAVCGVLWAYALRLKLQQRVLSDLQKAG